MKILTLIGSPRKDGFSSRVLNIIGLSGCWVYDLNIKPCIGCNYCKENSSCFIEDDMVDVYRRVDCSQIFGVITPIYFMGVPGQLKVLIDRLQVYYYHPIENKKRYGFVFMIGEQPNKSFETYYKKMWSYIFRNIGIETFDFVLLGGIKNFSGISKYEDIIREVKSKIEVNLQ